MAELMTRVGWAGLALSLMSVPAGADGVIVTDMTRSPHARLRPVGLDEVQWDGGFWAERDQINRRVTIPTMKTVMENKDNAASFRNLRVAAGDVPGPFQGNAWSDGDCYKWIEAAASVFAATRDPELDRQMDELIDVIARAQAPDGYISTQVQLTDRPRWADLRHHELYNMGHLLTAAVIHHRATGKTTFLDVARKAADHLIDVFGPRPKALAHFGFNPSNIMGAVELYRDTGERKYLKLAGLFVTMRGSQPGGSDQNQSKVPLRREREAVGHAVTGAYLWAGAADVYAETGEPALLEALTRIWDDLATRKTYLTGGTGALHAGATRREALDRRGVDLVQEAFGGPYELPNRTAYNETCGNIASAMWSARMLALTGEAKYADAMERVFYNSMLSGVGLEGLDYFYTNPLRRGPSDVPLLKNDSATRWAETTPTSPVYCFCCPPNLARTIAQMKANAYSVSDGAVWVHLYGGGQLKTRLPDGSAVELTQITRYPWSGEVRVRIDRAPDQDLSLRVRVPGWCGQASVAASVEGPATPAAPGAYHELKRRWKAGDTVRIDLPMPVVMVASHPLVEENRNQVAVMRGPLVYCVESVDLPEGVQVEDVVLPRGPAWEVGHDPALLHGVTVLSTRAQVVPPHSGAAGLYREGLSAVSREIALRMVPYYAWSNRGRSEMTVWLPVR
jgi:DUF1680 family protein